MANRNLARAALLSAALVAGLSLSITGQQGWSLSQPIKQGDKPATLNSVFYDGEQVWVVGGDGLVLRSGDYGENFNEVQLRTDLGLNDVFAFKDRVWLIGDEGTMFFSTDRGLSFVKNIYTAYGKGRTQPAAADSPSVPRVHLDLYSVQFVDREHGFIVGDEGLILESTDGGVTWRELRSQVNSQLFHLSFKGKQGWVVGTGGLIIHTDDGGRNWYPQQSGTNDDLNRVLMVSDEVGFVTGEKGTLLRTENGGATWVRVPLRSSQALYGMSFLDKKTGWVVGYGGTIIRTYDGGRNWVEQDSQTSTDLFAVSFHKNRGFSVGRDGVVLRYYERR